MKKKTWRWFGRKDKITLSRPVEFVIRQLEILVFVMRPTVKAEFVNHPEDYRYSRAVDYADGKGLLKIELIL